MKTLALAWPGVNAKGVGVTVLCILPFLEGADPPPDPVVGSEPVVSLVLEVDTVIFLFNY